MTTILDPTDERVPIRRTLAPRPSNLDGVVALLDIAKPRGNVLLDQLEARLGERFPKIEVRRYTKPTFTKPAPEALRQTIRDEADAVVEALAD
jgi:hypothetical protein